MYILKQIANDKLKNYFNCKTPVDSLTSHIAIYQIESKFYKEMKKFKSVSISLWVLITFYIYLSPLYALLAQKVQSLKVFSMIEVFDKLENKNPMSLRNSANLPKCNK